MFFERLQSLCEEKQMTVTGFLKKMGWSTSKVTVWKGAPPVVSTLNEIAEYFNVSTDYLLGNSDIKKQSLSFDKLSQFEYECLEMFRSLPPEEQKRMLELGELLLLKQRQSRQ